MWIIEGIEVGVEVGISSTLGGSDLSFIFGVAGSSFDALPKQNTFGVKYTNI